MSREEANMLLRRVRAGFFFRKRQVEEALIATGDLRPVEPVARRRKRLTNFGRTTR